jgi:hypothetical protein
MMHGESFTQIKNDILFKEGKQNHVLILFYVQMVYVVVMIDTIIFMVVRNVLKRIEKLFSITA